MARHERFGIGTRTTIGVVAAVTVLWACGRDGAETEAAEAPVATTGAERPEAQGAEAMKAACPMMVEGVEVSSTSLDEGAALVFMTEDPGQVEDLRARVRHMVAMHTGEGTNAGGGGQGMMHGGGEGGGMHHGGGRGEGMEGTHGGGPGMRMEAMHEAQATVTDVEQGVRVELRAEDPARTDELRQEVQQYARHLQEGRCPMMQRG